MRSLCPHRVCHPAPAAAALYTKAEARAEAPPPRHPPAPSLDLGRRAGRSVLRGELPSPLNPPAGCAFHTRCPHADGECAARRPEPRPYGGREVACHHVERIG